VSEACVSGSYLSFPSCQTCKSIGNCKSPVYHHHVRRVSLEIGQKFLEMSRPRIALRSTLLNFDPKLVKSQNPAENDKTCLYSQWQTCVCGYSSADPQPVRSENCETQNTLPKTNRLGKRRTGRFAQILRRSLKQNLPEYGQRHAPVTVQIHGREKRVGQ
jgi:hypothetical protein